MVTFFAHSLSVSLCFFTFSLSLSPFLCMCVHSLFIPVSLCLYVSLFLLPGDAVAIKGYQIAQCVVFPSSRFVNPAEVGFTRWCTCQRCVCASENEKLRVCIYIYIYIYIYIHIYLCVWVGVFFSEKYGGREGEIMCGMQKYFDMIRWRNW